MTLRICILEADDLHPSLQDAFSGFGHMFKQLLKVHAGEIEFQVFNVVSGHYPDNDECFDAYLVTGSKADSFGDDPWIVHLRTYLHQRFIEGDVLLGICFGHQILALVLGGNTQRSSKGWGIGVHCYQLVTQPQWMVADTAEFELLISHRDQVTALPEGAQLLARSEFCENAAFVLGDQVLCFQGHPEFTHDFSRALLQIRQSVYCPDEYQKACDSLLRAHDGQQVAQWMLSFIEHAKAASRAQIKERALALDRESLCLA